MRARRESAPAQTPRRLPNRRFYGSEIDSLFQSTRLAQWDRRLGATFFCALMKIDKWKTIYFHFT